MVPKSQQKEYANFRYVAIYLPMYYKTINTYKNAYMAIAGSFIGGVLVHIALFFDHEVIFLYLPNTYHLQLKRSDLNLLYFFRVTYTVSNKCRYSHIKLVTL